MHESTLDLGPGVLVDHYRVLRGIGVGGMGRVYLARDTELGRRVALKVIRQDRLRSAEAVDRFLFEAKATARFNHPNIVTVYGVGTHQGQPYVALEYVEGQSLRARMRDGGLRPKEVLRIARSIADALAHAHAKDLLHRDLKPENVLIGVDGRVRVVDFGLAKRVGTGPGPLKGPIKSPKALVRVVRRASPRSHPTTGSIGGDSTAAIHPVAPL